MAYIRTIPPDEATGALKELRLVSEYPPLVGFGRAAAEDFRVASFIPAFRDAASADVHATLRPVGALKEMLLAGKPCDVLVSTATMLDELAREG